jgi:hypothetical protein
MNGWLALVALSSSASGALGVFVGRKLEWRNAYGAGEVMGEYNARYGMDSMLAKAAQEHGHSLDEPCTMRCYERMKD